jgi:ABC-2 type transport system permease protein
MAGLAAGLSAGEQLKLIAQLRWRLLVNSLRTLRGRLELVARVLASLTLAGMVVGIAFALAAGSFYAVRTEKYWLLSLMLWLVFLIWQLYPLLVAAATTQFDFRNLLRFPLRFSSFMLLSLAYGLFDPAAVAGTLWLCAMTLGILFARPGLVLIAIPIFVLFALVNLLLGRMLFAWLERWFAQRRTREMMAIVFFVLIMSLQFAGPLAQHLSRRHREPNLGRIEEIQRVFPAGAAAQAISSVQGGDWLESGLSIALLLGYGVGLAALLVIRLRAQYRGEDLSESRAPVVGAAAGPVAPGWQLPGLSGPVSAILEKEVHYLFRSGPMLLNLAIPPILLLFFAFSAQQAGRHASPFALPADLLFPVAVGYSFLVQTNLVYNSFAFDGNGIQFLFVAPVRFAQIFAGKNLYLGLLALIEMFLMWAGVSILAHPPGAMVVLTMFAALTFVTLVNCAAGNLVSLYFPRRFEFGMFRRQRPSGVTMLISMGIQAVLLGLSGGIFVLARWKGVIWLSVLIYLVLAAAAWPLYRWALRRCDQVAPSRREVLTTELCRQL